MDNLKLHKIYLEKLKNSNPKLHIHSKYLKKMFKILSHWQERLENTNVEMSEGLT
jgi:hypothetical protein